MQSEIEGYINVTGVSKLVLDIPHSSTQYAGKINSATRELPVDCWLRTVPSVPNNTEMLYFTLFGFFSLVIAHLKIWKPQNTAGKDTPLLHARTPVSCQLLDFCHPHPPSSLLRFMCGVPNII